MAIYQLKTFKDILDSVAEELGIQSSDTTALNRIRRDINTIYLSEVVPAQRWTWLRKRIDLSQRPSFSTGSCSVTKASVTVTLSETPTVSYAGYWFSTKGSTVRHRILSHSANSSTLTLESPYTDNSNTDTNFTIWTDEVPLPPDCEEVIEVAHDYHASPLDNRGLQEFRRLATTQPKAEAKPRYYTTTGWLDPAPFDSVTLPASAARTSSGRLKTITLASSPSSVSVGQFIKISGAGDDSYNTDDAIIASISGNDITYVGPRDAYETDTSDTGISVEVRNQERFGEKYRNLLVWPAVDDVTNIFHVDYVRIAQPLEDDGDEPLMPVSDRIVLKYGALSQAWVKQRNPEEAARNDALYQRKLAKMLGDTEDSVDKPQIRPSREYIGQKRSRGRGFKQPLYGYTGFGPIGTGGSTLPTGTASRAAVFGSDGRLQSSDITTTELGYLDGATSNIQTQLDNLGAGYVEDAVALTTTTLTDNATTTAASFIVASFDVVHLHYSIVRGSAYEAGIVTLVSDGTNASIAAGATAAINSTGATFSADVSGGNLRLRIALSSTGADATFKYKALPWVAA